MINLKCSKFIGLEIEYCSELDMQIRQYEDEDRIIYLGQCGQVIQFPERLLSQIIEFLNKSKELETIEDRIGWLK